MVYVMKTFVVADTHFGHKNVITFTDESGEVVRKFDSIEEHDEYLVQQWNRTVGPFDKVYHLGDVVMNKRALTTMERLNGRKVLIKGNHDIFKLKDYTPYFEDIRAYKIMPAHGIIMSHMPIHPQCMSRWKLNIHGHLHDNEIEVENFNGVYQESGLFKDERYMCLSVEHTNYAPVDLQEIIDGME